MKTILIVEDEAQLASAYREKLEKEYQLEIVSTTSEALGLIIRGGIDLIILDIMLPGGENGFDFLGRLKQTEQAKGIPILVVTNLGENERQTAMELGAKEYIVKTNISLEELVETIKRYLK